ncbi:MAG: hypothetical protein RI895_1334 [Actinomycetota bacterium]
MNEIKKAKALVTGLLAATLAISGISASQAAELERQLGSINNAIVGVEVTVGNATSGCAGPATCQFSYVTTPELMGTGSKSDGNYTFTPETAGTYTIEITGKKGIDTYVSLWTIVASAPSAPSAPSVAEAKKYAVTVTGYAYKKTGKSTLDERRCAAVSSYLQSLGLDSTNSTYSEAGVELSKSTKSARSAVVSVTYLKDGASVTVKKRIYFTAKKSTLSKASKAKLNAFASSVK